jgi:hypothetical protein
VTRHAGPLGIVLAILRRDLGQMHRQGLPVMIVVTVLLIVLGAVLFGMATDQFDKSGVPTWTGSVILGTEEGDLVVEAFADSMLGPAPHTVNFTSVVSGGDGPFTYEWDFGDGSSSSEAAPRHTFQEPGSYQVYLNARSGGGAQGTSVAMQIAVRGPSEDWMMVVIHVNRTEGPSPLSAGFTSAVSGGMPPYTYEWRFDDGNTSSDPSPSHVFTFRDGSYNVSLTVRDSGTNESSGGWFNIEPWGEEGGEGSVPFTLLDVVYGYAVLVTAVLLPMAFTSCYVHEMKRGTVRTLVCYPVGVLGITAAKLLFAAIVGGVLAFVAFSLPTGGIGKPSGERFGVFLTAYLLTLVTVAIGALLATALTAFTRRMYLRPTAGARGLVLLSVMTTHFIFTILAWLVKRDFGAAADMVDRYALAITMSPYHQGGALLSAAFGGTSAPNALVFIVPVLLLIGGYYVSRRVYPDIY